MNNYDLMVGGGISSLLGNGHSDVAAPGAFDFAQRSEPVVRMAYGGEAESQFEDVYRPEATPTYSDEQIAQAMQESMKQGFSLEDTLLGAQQKYGIPADRLTRAQELFTPAKTTPDIVSDLQAAGAQEVVPTTFETPQAAIQYAIKSQLSAPDALGATPQTFGQFNVTPVTEKTRAFDEYGSVMPASYYENLSDKTIGYNLSGAKGVTNKGVNYEASIDYDASGALQGYTVNYKTGRDSGAEVRYDASGKPVWSEAYDYSEGWRKPVAMGIGFIAAMYGIPGIGEALGATTAVGQGALGGAFVGGLTSAVSGAEGSDILKGAAVGAASGAVGQGLGKEAGEFAAKGVGGEYGNVIGGAVKGGVQALPGAIATGDVSQVGIGALMGGATAAGSGAISDALKEYGITPGQAQAGVNIARAISSGNTAAIINQLGPLTGSRDVNIASKAALALNAISKGNPIAATAAIIQLGNALSSGAAKATPVKTADVGGGPFETSAIFEGTEGGGTAEGDFMGLLGTLGDQAGDYPGQEAGPRMFNAAGQMIAAPKGEFIDLPDGRYIDDRGVIFKPDGSLWSPSGAATDPFAATGNIIGKDQRVDISGEPFRSREDIALDYFFYPGEDKPMYDEAGQRIIVSGKPYEEEMGTDLGQIDIVGKPYTDTTDLGKIDIVGKPYVEEPPGVVEGPDRIEIVGKPLTDLEPLDLVGPIDLSDIITSLKEIGIPTVPGATTPGTKPDTKTPITTTPTTKAAQTAALAAAAKNLYALPGDLPLFKSVFYEMERQKELARQAKEIENADKDPYDILMELAEENPGMAVDELMKIIEGGQRG